MRLRKFGVEEELLLVDPATGKPRSVSHLALAAHDHRARASDGEDGNFGPDAGLDQELFLQQLETGTKPCQTADELLAELLSCRRVAAASAAGADATLVASGTSVLAEDEGHVTPKPRYERIITEYGEIGEQGSVCGMHVHVDIDDEAEGVRVIDGLRPWLPVLRAMSVNSPFFHGRDTGYASWRAQVWGRWPTAGPSDPFGDPRGYRRATAALIDAGVALDAGMLYFDVRLSQHYPTVEVRVFDTMSEPDDVLLLALLSRALVATLAAPEVTGPAPVHWRHELLRAAHWRASRYGLAEDLLDPLTGGRRPARDAIEELVARVADALRDAGDLERVTRLVEALMSRGTGAARQRAAFERGGLPEVVADLRARFDRSLAS